jgi:hypothetical protein
METRSFPSPSHGGFGFISFQRPDTCPRHQKAGTRCFTMQRTLSINRIRPPPPDKSQTFFVSLLFFLKQKRKILRKYQ